MKNYYTLCNVIVLFFLTTTVTIAAVNPVDEYIKNNTLQTTGELKAATNLKGIGLQVAGQSSSPRDIKFTWTDNSVGENGYIFQRKKALIYWNFGCEAPANATSKTHNLDFLPAITENFRMYAYIGEERSEYAYITVEMLRSDLSLSNVTINKTTVEAGTSISVSCIVQNTLGTYQAVATTLKYYISTSPTGTTKLLGSDDVVLLPIGASSAEDATLTIPLEYTSGSYYIVFYADANDVVKELNAANNFASKQIIVTGVEPYYQITDFTYTGDATPDGILTFNIKVKNNGKKSGVQGWIDVMWVPDYANVDEIAILEKEFCTTGTCRVWDQVVGDYQEIPVSATKTFTSNNILNVGFPGDKFWLIPYIKNYDNKYTWLSRGITVLDWKKSAQGTQEIHAEDIPISHDLVYPNPSTGIVNISMLNNSYNSIRILNMLGSEVLLRKIEPEEVNFTLDLSECQKGIYVIEFIGETSKENRLVVIE